MVNCFGNVSVHVADNTFYTLYRPPPHGQLFRKCQCTCGRQHVLHTLSTPTTWSIVSGMSVYMWPTTRSTHFIDPHHMVNCVGNVSVHVADNTLYTLYRPPPHGQLCRECQCTCGRQHVLHTLSTPTTWSIVSGMSVYMWPTTRCIHFIDPHHMVNCFGNVSVHVADNTLYTLYRPPPHGQLCRECQCRHSEGHTADRMPQTNNTFYTLHRAQPQLHCSGQELRPYINSSYQQHQTTTQCDMH